MEENKYTNRNRNSLTIAIGDRYDHICPICKETIKTIGDLNNNNAIIIELHMCEDCKIRIRKLIGK